MQSRDNTEMVKPSFSLFVMPLLFLIGLLSIVAILSLI